MATGDLIFSSSGSETTAITGASTRASGAFSTSGEVTAITGNTFPLAKAVLSCTFGTAPTEGNKVHLYRRAINIQSTNDATIPEEGYEYKYVGSFAVKDTTSAQYIDMYEVPLIPGDMEFYIENDTDQTLSSGYNVYITPYTVKKE